jgi:hypothetical protein
MRGATSVGVGFERTQRPTPPRRVSFSPFDPNTPHLRFAVVSILVLWLIVLTALNFLPKHFISKSTLIVPGSSTSVNVALDKIGQASSAPVSAYNTVALSPKVVYKEMVQSDEVRADAARDLGLSLAQFGMPRIKLIDETSLIHIEMRSRDGLSAHKQNVALINALQRRLDKLRADELSLRAGAVQDNLKFYEDALSAARRKIADLQSATGLQSNAQFNEVSMALIRRTQRMNELRGELDRLETEQSVLVARVGVAPQTAALSLKLTADPTVTKWLQEYAEAAVPLRAERLRLGSENPIILQMQRRLDSVTQALHALTQRNGLVDLQVIELLVQLTNSSHQADLFKRLVANESALEGRRAETRTTEREVANLAEEHARLGKAASELEDLKKTQLVAEAIFTTAMTRIHTSKSDIFGSYPLIQTLAAPSLTHTPGGAQGLYGIAGGVLGTLLLALAWFLAWLRTGSGQKTLKNA